MRALVLLAAVLALGSACTPTCEAVCRKSLECGYSPRLTQDECERECSRQKQLYEDWDDEAKQDQFDDHRSCVASSTCEELDAGVCYDEDLFPY